MVFTSKFPIRIHAASSLNHREDNEEEDEKMTTKMKGLFKGLRYISHIFEEEKEDEIQIGFPTDVKHVAHIGWDGPSTESATWMKEYQSPTGGFQSAPLGLPGETKEDVEEIKWVSSDSKRGNKGSESPARDPPDVPKSSRRRPSKESNSVDSPKKKDHSSSTRPRRRSSKDSAEGSVKSSRSSRDKDKDSSEGSVRSSRSKPEPLEEGSVKSNPYEPSGSMVAMDSPSRGLPDIPKKTRRKKSKESVSAGRSRSKESINEESNNGMMSSQISSESGLELP